MALRRRLAFRIIGLSSIWIIFALVFTAAILVRNHRDHTAEHYDNHVKMHMEELISAVQFTEDGSFSLTINPSDPRYHDLFSGWYWEVKQAGNTLRRSPSLGEESLYLKESVPAPIMHVHQITGPGQALLRAHVIKVTKDANQEPLVLIATAPTTGIIEESIKYSNYIISSFIVLGIGLILAVVLQVRVALKPLKAISDGISNIREGKSTRLPGDQLEDIQPFVDELNNLLDHNTVLVNRARNRLGDLAHAVKNPLTVINNAAQGLDDASRDLILQQTRDIGRSINHHLSRARTYGTEKVLGSRSSIRTVTEDLVYAMRRIYKGRDLVFDLSGLQDCWFKGEVQDLEEMLGNILDNACKWAKGRVKISSTSHDGRFEISVDDDGPGIAGEEFENVIRRGYKLDDAKPGHGEGLGIVKDISELYGGALLLARSGLGGLQAQLVLPSA